VPDSTAAGPLADLSAAAVAFARRLRAVGVDASPVRVQAFVRALDRLDVTRREHVFWAGRITLCAGPAELARYDDAFDAWFATGSTAPETAPTTTSRAVGLSLVAEPEDAAADPLGIPWDAASRREVLRRRDIAELSAADHAELMRLMARMALRGDLRRTRRSGPAPLGSVDRRRTLRRMLAAGGEPVRLVRHAPRDRPRRVVLLVDVSGSMRLYADALLRFAHVAARRSPSTELFTFGTRLTRVSRAVRQRDPDAALREVMTAVPDWAGGTRLGEMLKQFLDDWGQRGMARGAVVVVMSDGWERGDPSLLGEQMARLRRLAHRVVWANPRAGRPGFAPVAGGMAAALPHVDELVSGHSLEALEQLAAVVAGARSRPAHADARSVAHA
jgi:uncharacterized protein with von Willebrand factor type A (vWA) domain